MQEQQQVNKARLIGYGIGIVAVAIVLVAQVRSEILIACTQPVD
jgi:archaellin